MKSKYVFIVGLPRTGTKLVKNILEGSQNPYCKISPETYFLGHFISPGVQHKIKAIGDMSDDNNIHKLVALFYSDEFNWTYWKLLKRGDLGVDRETFEQELLQSDRSYKDIYKVMLRIHAKTTENAILGDKTPGHLYHVQTIFNWFPEAKVIHTFRDPRAILASEWKKRMRVRSDHFWGKLVNPIYSFAIVVRITIAWLYAIKLHHKYQKIYPQNYYLSKFEDLVERPEVSIKALCEFMAIEFQPEMLTPRHADSSYSGQKGSGFDAQAINRWQDFLKPWMQTWLMFWGKKYLKEFGYIH